MTKPPLYPHIPKSRKTSDRVTVTTMEERFTIDCSYCGFLVSERTLNEALVTARRLALRHLFATNEKVTVFDRLAQKGACQTYDTDGNCIGYKPWR